MEWKVEFTIDKNNIEQFKKYAAEMIKAVNNNEPGTTSYQWYFNEDETKCIVSEWYIDSNAGLDHLNGKAARTILGPKLLSVAKITKIEVYGNPNKELQMILARFDAVNYRPFSGFTR